MKKIFVALLITIAFVGCGNNIDCEDAEICIINTGNSTIYYNSESWGSNFHNDSILPGERVCKNVGPVSDHWLEGSNTVWVPFSSSHGYLMIEVATCYREVEIP